VWPALPATPRGIGGMAVFRQHRLPRQPPLPDDCPRVIMRSSPEASKVARVRLDLRPERNLKWVFHAV
jgi:hypothetical protein